MTITAKRIIMLAALITALLALAACSGGAAAPAATSTATPAPAPVEATTEPANEATPEPEQAPAEETPAPAATEEAGEDAPSTVSAGGAMANINALTLSGEAITGADMMGEKLTVLNIWATWCPPCIAELPHLQEVSEHYADKGVKLVGVMQDGVDESFEPDEGVIADGKALMEDAGANYMVVLPDETLFVNFIAQIEGFPTTYFIDSRGEIVHAVLGANDSDGWKKEIDGILEQLS